jgi:hypothetical protein
MGFAYLSLRAGGQFEKRFPAAKAGMLGMTILSVADLVRAREPHSIPATRCNSLHIDRTEKRKYHCATLLHNECGEQNFGEGMNEVKTGFYYGGYAGDNIGRFYHGIGRA